MTFPDPIPPAPITLHFTYEYDDFHYHEDFSWRKEVFSYRVFGWFVVFVCVFVTLSLVEQMFHGNFKFLNNGGGMFILVQYGCAGAYLYIRFKGPNRAKWGAVHPQVPVTIT